MSPVPVKYLQMQYCEKVIHTPKYYDAGKKGSVDKVTVAPGSSKSRLHKITRNHSNEIIFIW